MNKMGCVHLVGAGCGHADLITVRGLSLLRSCEVLVYDDLIDMELLTFAPESAERLYMGKRGGKPSFSQGEICDVLIAKAQSGKNVVRLKGGDPFVFGRGGEEMQALQSNGIPCDETPGISSAIAIPAAAGIPVTHRRLSRSFHVITAHTADDDSSLPEDFKQLAQLHGTLIFLMGLGQLPMIANALISAGKSPLTPAAVISGGNSSHPVAVRGQLQNITQLADEAHVVSPAVILIGETAALDFSSTIHLPLKHVKIGLVGTSSILKKLDPALRACGAEVFCAQESLVKELPLHFDLAALCDGRTHWIVFTSSNGIRIFFKHLSAQRVDLRRLGQCKFAVIGAATGDTLRSYGILPDLCPRTYTSDALADALCAAAHSGEDLYLFRSALGSRSMLDTLHSANLQVHDIATYDLTAPQPLESIRRQVACAEYLTFSSASGVELFCCNFGGIPEQAQCICIGEVTAKALGKVTAKPFLTAPEISANGIIQAILVDRQKNSKATPYNSKNELRHL